LDAYLFQTKYIIKKFFLFLSIRHLKMKYFVYKYIISIMFLLSTTIGSILFFIGQTCEFNEKKCVLLNKHNSNYYVVVSIIFCIFGSILLYIGMISLISKYEHVGGIKKIYDVVGYIHLCFLTILFYFHFMGPGVFTFVFYSWNSYSFNSSTSSQNYLSLPYSDYWFYFGSYLFYCLCGLSMYIYYYAYYHGDQEHPIRNAIKIGFPILLPFYDYVRKIPKQHITNNSELTEAIFRLYLRYKVNERKKKMASQIANENENADEDDENEDENNTNADVDADADNQNPPRTIYERFGNKKDDKNHLNVPNKNANNTNNKSKITQLLYSSISLVSPWQKREDRVQDLKKIAETVGGMITSGSKDKETVTSRWDDNSIVKLMTLIDKHQRLQIVLPIVGVILLCISPLMSCFIRIYEGNECYKNSYEELIVFYGFIVNLFFAQRMFKFFKSVNMAFIRSLSVAEVILEHDLQQIRNELSQIGKVVEIEKLAHEKHINYEEEAKTVGKNIAEEGYKKIEDGLKNGGLKKIENVIRHPKTAHEIFSRILEKMLHWNTSIISQIKIICAQVKQLELSIALLIVGILASTAFLSLVYLSPHYYHTLNQVWWQLFLFNSGLTINMLKVIYDIAQVGGNFVQTVQHFENIFVGEHFKFNKEFQEQFEKIFHIHSTMAGKWRVDGVKIKVFNKEINFTSVTNLFLVLISQGLVFLFHYVYTKVLKPFFTAN